jgi:ribose transport system permease protein
LAGIRSGRYVVAVFACSGLMCSLAALARTSRLASADPKGGLGMELAAIAACVIGGTSLLGGRGSVIGTFLGVLIIAVLESGLAQMGVPDAHKQIVTGTVIIIAVLLDALRNPRRRGGGSTAGCVEAGGGPGACEAFSRR